MKRLFSFLLALLLALISVAVPAAPAVFQQVGERIGSVVYDVTHKDEFSPFEQKTGPPTLALSATQHFSPRWVQGNNPRQQLTNLLSSDGSTVADYQPGNYTGTLNASAWLNSIGAAPSLAQASGAAQPIILPYSGQKYLANFAVAGNGVTSPNKSITGNFTIAVDVALNTWTPASTAQLLQKLGSNNGFYFYVLTTGKLELRIYNGTTFQTIDSTVAVSATDGSRHIVKAVWTDGVGVTFYVDGVQLGTTVASALVLTNAAVSASAFFATTGKAYSLTIDNGAGTGYYGFNASDWPETTTNGATAVSSTTGETWTLANTGTLLAQIVGSPWIVTDGVATFMQATQAVSQPVVMILVGKPITLANNNNVISGTTANNPVIIGASATTIEVGAGSTFGPAMTLTMNTPVILTGTFNGASSSLQSNNASAVAASLSTTASTGFSIGANYSGTTNFANWQYKEIIILNAVPSAAKLAQIQNLLNQIYHIYAPYASANDWLNELPTVAANDETYRLAANGR